MRNNTDRAKNHTEMPKNKAHNRDIMKNPFNRKDKVNVRVTDRGFQLVKESGGLAAGGVTFPSLDAAIEFLRNSQLLKV